ncbi:unnamed protein product (macronuclear) [Paramecium tetraurelia]|uniref:Uncharacterized protein n=1 Tax=Paramecium tetraurelia TaxID=5888 RepID=A0BF68_PARTE|nr:uncharacterized protein GSPATT00028220001 [Paramecium tetraurelia]CAK57185.1 unnamed protein product [Paramecium tetraurelia]|eukprot:XP_001424583.1 hypothetical protein (macronuclear) [Paramecium tetraurelia strain d4-2]
MQDSITLILYRNTLSWRLLHALRLRWVCLYQPSIKNLQIRLSKKCSIQIQGVTEGNQIWGMIIHLNMLQCRLQQGFTKMVQNWPWKVSSQVVKQKVEDNSICVLLPHNYTIHDTAEFNGHFNLQQKKEGGKSSSFPINHLNLLLQSQKEVIQLKLNISGIQDNLHHLPKSVPIRPNVATTEQMNKIQRQSNLTLIEGDEFLTAGWQRIYI